MRLSARNSGLFYLRATKEALAMMIALKRRMETEGVWDQVSIRRHTPFSPYVAPRFPHMSEITSLFSFFVDQTAYNENMWYAAREEKEELTPPHPLTAMPTPHPHIPNPTPHPPIPNPTPHSLAPPATPISLTLSPAHPLTRSPPKPAATPTPGMRRARPSMRTGSPYASCRTCAT